MNMRSVVVLVAIVALVSLGVATQYADAFFINERVAATSGGITLWDTIYHNSSPIEMRFDFYGRFDGSQVTHPLPQNMHVSGGTMGNTNHGGHLGYNFYNFYSVIPSGDGTVTVTYPANSFILNGISNYAITYSFVYDGTNPTFVLGVADFNTVELNKGDPAPIVHTIRCADDNKRGNFANYFPKSIDPNTVGETLVKYTCTDFAGNSVSETKLYRVLATIPADPFAFATNSMYSADHDAFGASFAATGSVGGSEVFFDLNSDIVVHAIQDGTTIASDNSPSAFDKSIISNIIRTSDFDLTKPVTFKLEFSVRGDDTRYFLTSVIGTDALSLISGLRDSTNVKEFTVETDSIFNAGNFTTVAGIEFEPTSNFALSDVYSGRGNPANYEVTCLSPNTFGLVSYLDNTLFKTFKIVLTDNSDPSLPACSTTPDVSSNPIYAYIKSDTPLKAYPTTTLDTTAPAIPSFTNSTALVSTTSIKLVGTAEADSIVALYDVGKANVVVRVDASSSGDFTFTGIPFTEGPNSFTITASDGTNVSGSSDALVITLDRTNPDLHIGYDPENLSVGDTIPTLVCTDVNNPVVTHDAGSTTFDAAGVKVVIYTCTDDAGNFDDTQTVSYNVAAAASTTSFSGTVDSLGDITTIDSTTLLYVSAVPIHFSFTNLLDSPLVADGIKVENGALTEFYYASVLTDTHPYPSYVFHVVPASNGLVTVTLPAGTLSNGALSNTEMVYSFTVNTLSDVTTPG